MFNGAPGKKRTDGEKKRALDLLATGLTVKQVHDRLKISESAIRNWVRLEKKAKKSS